MNSYEVFGRKASDGHRVWLYTTDKDGARKARAAGLVVITTHAATRDYGANFKSKGQPDYRLQISAA